MLSFCQDIITLCNCLNKKTIIKKKSFYNHALLYKIVIVGESDSGKTSLCQRYVYHSYIPKKQKVMVGIDYYVKEFFWKNNIPIVMELWEISEKERYNNNRDIRLEYYYGASGILITCEVNILFNIYHEEECCNNKDNHYFFSSKDKLNFWINDIQQSCRKESIPFILVITKCDDPSIDQNEIFKKANIIAKKFGFTDFILTSSKKNKNIDAVFDILLHNIYLQFNHNFL